MNTIKFYWEYHKSTLIMNWAISAGFSMILLSLLSFPVMSMTGGPVICIFYKEIARKNEYYFYYNQGISKINLIVVSLLLNVLVGIILISIIQNARLS